MAGRDGGLFVSPTERTIPNDPERTLATPRFDEKSVQAARAAVPLNLRTRVRSWPLAVVVTCVAVGLIGGALVGFGLTYYFRDNPRDAQQQAAGDTAANANESATAPTTTPGQPSKTDAQNSTNSQSADASGSQQPSDATANNAAANANAAGAAASSPPKNEGDDSGGATAEADAGTRGELQAALGDWVAATNARDINRQMKYYAPTVEDYYLTRNASREAVRAEKARVFGKVDSVDVRASAPDIRLSRDGQTAVMRFRKQYQIGSGTSGRSGAVLQELRWRRTPAGWKIVGERDLRVLQ
ncbi:MAG TPA: nuclear transport factor 2 family protein [Pyrinomonadaceae bacterium]|nr:nuclear transport factor 2 family protein [Pyrinomonadaceae bacterium]